MRDLLFKQFQKAPENRAVQTPFLDRRNGFADDVVVGIRGGSVQSSSGRL